MGKDQVFKQNLHRLMSEAGFTLESLGLQANLDREGRKWLARIHADGLSRTSSATAKKLELIARCLKTEVSKFWEPVVAGGLCWPPEQASQLDYVLRIQSQLASHSSQDGFDFNRALEFRSHVERVIAGLYHDAQQVMLDHLTKLAVPKIKKSKDGFLKDVALRSGTESSLSKVIRDGICIARDEGHDIHSMTFDFVWDEVIVPTLERAYFPNEAQQKKNFAELAIKAIHFVLNRNLPQAEVHYFYKEGELDVANQELDASDQVGDIELDSRLDFEDLSREIRSILAGSAIGKIGFETAWKTILLPNLKSWFHSNDLGSVYDEICGSS